MDYKKIMENAIEWAREVGKLQREALKTKDFAVELKDSEIDFVTDMDKLSDKILVNKIKETYPDHNIFSEEQGFQPKKPSDYKWLIDPIDGTTNFVHGFPHFSISIALKNKDEIVVGVVYAPVTDMMFYAYKNGGAYLNGERIQVAKETNFRKCIMCTGFPYDHGESDINLDNFERILKQVAGIRRLGSSALDICFVAAGWLNAYWEFSIDDYDVSGGAIILSEAGGKYSFKKNINRNLFVGASPEIYDQLYPQITEIERR